MKRSLITAGSSLLLFILLTWAVRTDTSYIVKWDDRAVEWFTTSHEGTVIEEARFFTHFGDYFICFGIGAAILLLLLTLGRFRMVFWIFLGFFGVKEVNHVLKAIIDRDRPAVEALTSSGLQAFPSGHSMYATFTYGMLLLVVFYLSRSLILKTAAAVVTLSIIGMVLWSRVYLGVHYPTDTAAGLLAGLVWLNVIWSLAFFQRKKQKGLGEI
ncbi:phosphatase PAP2 family protein [Halobacillus massiliensis]|uniref:phosphatase PAP2 family protein n=1 Tax=Halobacillus massiliensis TaxID=1926286 RepID=UPI0015C4E366|nr:phosphatase PAP2 family protein [Halobacillus massiliensis]